METLWLLVLGLWETRPDCLNYSFYKSVLQLAKYENEKYLKELVC